MSKKVIYGISALVLIVQFALLAPLGALAVESSDPRGETKDVTGKIIPFGYCFGILKQGTRGPQVEDLQNILKSDPTIYPEGLTTGYYGNLTKKAIERLQKKFGLPETGEVDERTAKAILPCPIDVKITVISPNGGESWDRATTHEITWKLGPTETGATPLSSQNVESRWFWPRGRVDLLKSDGAFVKHIATVNLAHQTYTWKISSSVPNGSDYKIRIGLGPVVACPEGKVCPLSYNPKFTFGDESDNTFSITGEIPPSPDKIGEAIRILQGVIEQLQKLLSLLESLR